MSKRAILASTILQADSTIVKNALHHIVEMNDGTLKVLNKNKFRVRSKLLGYYSVVISIVNGQVQVEGEESDIVDIEEIIRQYYAATEVENIYEGVSLEKDAEGVLLLTAEVNG